LVLPSPGIFIFDWDGLRSSMKKPTREEKRESETHSIANIIIINEHKHVDLVSWRLRYGMH
jgi:hypothetical protein